MWQVCNTAVWPYNLAISPFDFLERAFTLEGPILSILSSIAKILGTVYIAGPINFLIVIFCHGTIGHTALNSVIIVYQLL